MELEIPRTGEVRKLLKTAGIQLAGAHRHLSTEPRQYAEAAASLVDVVETSVRAFLTWHGGDRLEGAPLTRRAERAISLASILRTPLDRTRKLVPVAEHIQEGATLSIRKREAVLEGFYAVRNLYFTLLGALPSAVQPDLTLPPDAAVPAAERRTMAHAA